MTTIVQWLGEDSFESLLTRYEKDGFLVFENVLSSKELSKIRHALSP